MEDAAPPAFGQTPHWRQLIPHAGGQQESRRLLAQATPPRGSFTAEQEKP